MSELIKYLHAVDIKFDIYNGGSQGKLNHMVTIYVNPLTAMKKIVPMSKSNFF